MVSWTPFRKALGIQWDEKVSNFALGPCLGSNSPALPGPPPWDSRPFQVAVRARSRSSVSGVSSTRLRIPSTSRMNSVCSAVGR